MDLWKPPPRAKTEDVKLTDAEIQVCYEEGRRVTLRWWTGTGWYHLFLYPWEARLLFDSIRRLGGMDQAEAHDVFEPVGGSVLKEI